MHSVDLKNEIVTKLSSNKDISRIILFGSYARGTPGPESDVDIIVILGKKGFSRSYSEMIENRMCISKPLMQLREKVPIDILVYTADEWNRMVQLQSDFIKTVQEEGVELL